MIKIVCLFVFALIGAAFTLPASDSVNQRDPVQIKISNENPPISPLDNNESNDPPAPFLDSDLKDSFNRDPEANKDENLEPAETFGFGYGLGLGYSGWGGRYNGYSGYGGWGRGYSGYGGYGYPGYGGYGRRHGYGGYGRRSYYY